jgi:hypothetical protein
MTEQPYTDEALELFRKAKAARAQARFAGGRIQLDHDVLDQAAAAVITAAMAEKDAEIAR